MERQGTPGRGTGRGLDSSWSHSFPVAPNARLASSMVAFLATFGMPVATGAGAFRLNIDKARFAIVAAVRAAGGALASSEASTRSTEELAGAGAAEPGEEASCCNTDDLTRTRLARDWQSSPWLDSDTSESLASESSLELDGSRGLEGGGLRTGGRPAERGGVPR